MSLEGDALDRLPTGDNSFTAEVSCIDWSSILSQ